MMHKNIGKEIMGARAPFSLSAAEEREATTRAVRSIVRRLGVVLGAALDAAISEMLRHQMIDTAGELRDSLKPLVDGLVHFELENVDETP